MLYAIAMEQIIINKKKSTRKRVVSRMRRFITAESISTKFCTCTAWANVNCSMHHRSKAPPGENDHNHTEVSQSTDVAASDDVTQETVVYADLDVVEFQAARCMYGDG